MNELDLEHSEPSFHEGPQGPGEQLRRAREARRLSVEEAARQLRLSPSVVHALEKEDYGRIPYPSFVRGYLRSYARLLDLPEEPLLYHFDSHWRQGGEAGLKPAPLKPQIGLGDHRMRWVTGVIVLLIATLPFIWWLTQGTSSLPESTPEAPDKVTQEVPSLADVLKEKPSEEIILSGPEAPLAESGTEVPQQAPVQEGQAQKKPEEIPVQAPTQDVLTLRFKEDTWAQVTGGEGHRLLFETVKGGTVKTFEGRGPFRVILGKPSVEVEYDGKPFDITPYQRRGVARFTVGGNHEE